MIKWWQYKKPLHYKCILIKFFFSPLIVVPATMANFWRCCSLQIGRVKATFVAQSSNIFKPNQPLSHSHNHASHYPSFLLPLAHNNSSAWCTCLMDNLCSLWNLACIVLASRPNPQVVPYYSWNLPWTFVHKIWAWRGGAKPSSTSWYLCDHCRPFEGTTYFNGEHGSVSVVCLIILLRRLAVMSLMTVHLCFSLIPCQKLLSLLEYGFLFVTSITLSQGHLSFISLGNLITWKIRCTQHLLRIAGPWRWGLHIYKPCLIFFLCCSIIRVRLETFSFALLQREHEEFKVKINELAAKAKKNKKRSGWCKMVIHGLERTWMIIQEWFRFGNCIWILCQ